MKEVDVRALAEAFVFQGQSLQGRVEETHISWVILTSYYAFKIKKPLRLSFLDFSTLSARKRFCEKELFLNRRFSDIYLNVVPLRCTAGRWIFGEGQGKVTDYAVVMKRMRSSKRMDKLLEQDRVTPDHMAVLARSVGAYHLKAEVIHSPFDRFALRDAFRDLETVRTFALQTLGLGYQEVISRAIGWSDRFIDRYADRFAERVSLGYRRDLHGDLHAGNIFLYSRPVIFDCIEFNDDYRQVDVLDELGFLCMDLESFNKAKLARTFLKYYLGVFSAMENEEDNAIFRYYKCYRANVRAKVHVLAAETEDVNAERNRHLEHAVRYIGQMNRYINQL